MQNWGLDTQQCVRARYTGASELCLHGKRKQGPESCQGTGSVKVSVKCGQQKG